VTCNNIFLKSIVLYCILIPVANADDSLSETKDKKEFPQNIKIEHNKEQLDLFMTGLTIRRKFFLKIYSMAHYIEQQPDSVDPENSNEQIYKNILQNNSAKQITMVFMRKLSAKQIQKSLRSGLKKNSSKNEYLQILPQVNNFMQAIYADINKNDEFIIRWFPDGTIISLFQGKQISSIKSVKFAKTLWAIWFGEFSVVDRKTLIKELLTSS